MVKERNLEFTADDLSTFRFRKGGWPHKSGTIDFVKATNLVPFLTPKERIRFVNELFRVLKVGGKAQLIMPHWCSARAMGDLSFEFPPITEAWFPHLNKEWRKAQAPWGNTWYRCDFDHTLGYGLHPGIINRNQEYQQHAVTFWKEAAQDLIVTLTKRGKGT